MPTRIEHNRSPTNLLRLTQRTPGALLGASYGYPTHPGSAGRRPISQARQGSRLAANTGNQHALLARARSARVHHATLLHYVAANGVEDFRQQSPPNAVTGARRLLEAGAEVDALADTYDGGWWQTTMNLPRVERASSERRRSSAARRRARRRRRGTERCSRR